jgi:glycosyltransferase involved in cell wall biosynthesis
LRILVLSNLYPPVVRGGYEVECSGVVDRLRERGHEVTVLTSSLDRSQAEPVDWIRRELHFVEYRRAHSLRAPFDAVRGAKIAQRLLDEVDPDLIYVWNGAQVPGSTLAVLARSGKPLAFRICEHWFGRLWTKDVFMRHLERGERGPRALWALAMRAVNRHPALRLDPLESHPAAVSWVSEALRGLSPAPRAFPPTFEQILFPVTRNQDRFRGVERSPSPEPVVLFAGRLEEEKGPDVVVRALARLPEEVQGVFAGPGDPEFVMTPARELGIDHRIEVTGPLPPERLVERMASAHALVIPSVWEDPLPLLCFEGALVGVPIVASRIGGMPELFNDGEHALLFPPGDHEALARALTQTFVDGDERAARAKARVEQFTFERYLGEQEEFVSQAAATSPPSSL